MSSENVEVIRSGYETLEAEGYEALIAFTHPDFEFSTPPALASEPDTYRGEEGVRRYFESFYDAMDDIHLDPHEFIDDGERVIVPTTIRARGRTTGIPVEQRLVLVWTLKDAKVITIDPVATLADATALRAADD